MTSTLTIFKKEIKSYLSTPSYYIICFLMSMVFSWIYPLQLSLFGDFLNNTVMQVGVPAQQMNIHYGVFLRQLSYLNLLLIFIVPALTMKLFSEEKKMRTFDLLLTSPVTSLDIVLGKFFSVLCGVGGLVLLALSYPIATRFLATFDWLPLLIAFGGIFLVGGVYAAMDLFTSSLTESIIVAYVASVTLNIAVWFVAIGADAVDSEWSRKFFEHISLNFHLSALVEGTVRTGGVLFILSLIGLFLFLCERVVESHRWR